MLQVFLGGKGGLGDSSQGERIGSSRFWENDLGDGLYVLGMTRRGILLDAFALRTWSFGGEWRVHGLALERISVTFLMTHCSCCLEFRAREELPIKR